MDEEVQREIEEIVNFQRKNINEQYLSIREVYNRSYNLGELDIIKSQICKCITLGLNIAAMTLINHLLEKSIKLFLIYSRAIKNKDEGGQKPFKMVDDISDATPLYVSENLSVNIKTAFKEGIINEGEKEILDKMRNDYRNSYSHSDSQKMYKDSSIGITEVSGKDQVLKFFQGNESGLAKREEKFVNLPFFDFVFILEHANENCIPYLHKLDIIIRDVKKRMMPNSENIEC